MRIWRKPHGHEGRDWSDGSFMNQRMLKMASKTPEARGEAILYHHHLHPQKDSTFPTPSSQTSKLQNCDAINFCLSHPVYDILLW